ncbi:MAG TPA: hypothetical protein VMS96_09780 [Terriglobales bacterium]|nr:hypothetical protein [Terriglobales bacterium]
MAAPTQFASPKRPQALVATLLLAGAAGVIAQIVLLRELLCLFEGNEFSIGLMLAIWLLATAGGSGILARLPATIGRERQIVALLQVVSALALPLAIVLIRSSRVWAPAVPGEMLGPQRMFLTSVLALGIVAPISGMLFTVASRWWMQAQGAATASATSSAYMLETLGAAAGGLLTSIALLPWISSLQIAMLLGTAEVLLALWIVSSTRTALGVSLPLLLCAGLLWPQVSRWDARSLALQWPGLTLLESATSKYGALAVVEANGGRSLAQSGVILFTAGDVEAAEEAVHFALLQHPAPRDVLLVGGGVNGSALQVVRHPSVERLDYVELDPRIPEIAERRFPAEWAGVRGDPRIHVHLLDGRAFLRSTGRKFDVIILNLPDPRTAQWNRFYTREFFDDTAAALNPGGVLGFQLRAAENYLNPQRAAFFQCIRQTLRQSFSEVRVIPGDTLYFLASNQRGRLQTDPDVLEQRVKERRLSIAYVRDYFLAFRLATDRQADMERLIAPTPATPVNRDFAPVAYYLDTSAWTTHFGRSYSRLLDALSRLGFRPIVLAVVLTAVIALGVLALLSSPLRAVASSSLCTAAMGMTMLVLELFLLLGFQALYGYVFHQLAIIIAGFMLGMGLGAWLAQRRPPPGTPTRPMILMQTAAVVMPFLLWAVLAGLGRLRDPRLMAVAAHLGFPVLAALCGATGGLQFPWASRVFFSSGGARNAGALYALDLLGSCAGAIAATLFLLPLFGLGRTAALLGGTNLCVALLSATAVAGDARSRRTPAR